jgi:hypothetical protein
MRVVAKAVAWLADDVGGKEYAMPGCETCDHDRASLAGRMFCRANRSQIAAKMGLTDREQPGCGQISGRSL